MSTDFSSQRRESREGQRVSAAKSKRMLILAQLSICICRALCLLLQLTVNRSKVDEVCKQWRYVSRSRQLQVIQYGMSTWDKRATNKHLHLLEIRQYLASWVPAGHASTSAVYPYGVCNLYNLPDPANQRWLWRQCPWVNRVYCKVMRFNAIAIGHGHQDDITQTQLQV